MCGRLFLVPLLAASWLATGTEGRQANQSVPVTAAAIIGGLAKLSLSAGSLTFPDADPDTVPVVTPSGGALSITAKTRTTFGSTATLTVQASDDLRSGTQVVPASALTWTASGPGFAAGTMNTSSAQLVGSWTSSGVRSGSQTYTLQNSWTYASGTYTMTITYTLTAP